MKRNWTGAKKLLLLALIAVLVLGVAACQEKQENPDWMEAWDLNDGGTAGTVASALSRGTAGTHQWGVWLNNGTFGKVLDFSTEESFFLAENTKADFSGDFTISAFIMAPPREEEDRTILCYGDEEVIKLYLKAEENFALTLEMEGIRGLETSGVSLTDSQWHHIMVTKEGSKVTYWVDGEDVKSMTVSGSLAASADKNVYLGANHKGRKGFDGSMAEVRLIKGAKTPAEATDTVIDPSDNEAKDTRMALKSGIVIDRAQYTENLIPLMYTHQSDIINCMNMGFDHVKLQLVPEWMIDEDGDLIEENLEYITSIVNMVVDLDYQALICVSPCASGIDYNFKTRYLGDLERFEELVKWYGQLAEYIKKQGWSADNVAIQIMTEPYDNSGKVSWTWMSDRMWGAIRNVLPDHTIVTSSDRSGNLEHVKMMSPATDWNLVYSFTTYEPYAVGWSSAYSSQRDTETFWNYIGEVPYPIEEGVDYTEAIEKAIENVPEKYKFEARSALTAYVKGTMDGGDAYWKNYYECLYNEQWHYLRAQSLDQWRQKYGGNIHIMCVEFGAYDSAYSSNRFGSAGTGVSDETRLLLIKHLRESFEAYDIGWSYWCYNEGFTVFNTDYHANYVGGSPTVEQATVLADYKLLTDSLGLTPKMAETLEEDLWDSVGAWELATDTDGSFSAAVSAWKNMLLNNVTTTSSDKFGSAALFDGTGYGVVRDPYFKVYNEFSLSAWIKTDQSGTVATLGDKFGTQTDGVYQKLMIHSFDQYQHLWGSANIKLDEDDPAEGTGSFMGISEQDGGDIILCSQLPRLDLSDYLKVDSSGAIHISLYISDASRITGGQLELCSTRNPSDSAEYSWDLGKVGLKSGWNDIVLRAEDALGTSADTSNLLCMRLYLHTRSKTAVKLDNFYAFFSEPTQIDEAWKLSVNASGNLDFQAAGLTGLTDSGAYVADGQWHHVMVTLEGNTFVYYVDGVAVKTLEVSGTLRCPPTADLIVGADTDKANGFVGSMSHLAVYAEAMTPEEAWQ